MIEDAAFTFTTALVRAIIIVLAMVGLISMFDYVLKWKPTPHSPPGYMSIIIDETRLVRCRSIDRSQPACTLISDCDDDVDRCVATFEILRRGSIPTGLPPAEE